MNKISIIIATFNSEKLLPRVLDSVKDQNYPQDQIEILFLDGGSVDNTFEIAKQYGCEVINNPRTEPVYAKYLAYLKAQGDYALYLDHDEVLENPESLKIKVEAMEASPKVKAVIGSGYKNPQGYSYINEYINEFGDPFSFFIYRLSKSFIFFIPKMKKNYPIISEDDQKIIFDLSQSKKLPILELCAAGGMIDLKFMKENFPETLKEPKLIPHFFYLLNSKNAHIAITKNDPLVHYSADNLKKYLNKIKWRVKNNIHHTKDMGASGFSGRNKFQPPASQLKKYLFIPYSFLLIPAFLDSLYLSLTRKKILYLLHTPLCVYTSLLIIYNYLIKILAIKPELKSYDGSKTIKNNHLRS